MTSPAILDICVLCKPDLPIAGALVQFCQNPDGTGPLGQPIETQTDGKIDPPAQFPPGLVVYFKVVGGIPPNKEPCFDQNTTTLPPGTPTPGTAPGVYCIPQDTQPELYNFTFVYQNIICVHEDTLVTTPNGPTPIKNLRTGDRVMDCQNREQRVLSNINTGSTRQFVRIKQHALGVAQPSNDLYIKAGHPVLVGGREVECQELVNGTTIDIVELAESAKLYSLVTQRRNFVDMQGVQVGTWAESQLANYLETDSHGRGVNVQRQ